jgi:hypothetical protein
LVDVADCRSLADSVVLLKGVFEAAVSESVLENDDVNV